MRRTSSTQVGLRHVNVRDLVIADRECLRLVRIEQLAIALAAHP